MFSWLGKFFQTQPVSEPPTPPPEPEPAASSFFSTHLSRARQSAAVMHLQQNAIPVTDAGFKAVPGTGADSSTAQTTAKNAFSVGQQRLPANLFMWYLSQGFIGYQACGLIAQHWLVDKACTVKGRDAVRNGYKATLNDGEELDPALDTQLRERTKAHGLKGHMEQATKFRDVFGIRHILYVVDLGDDQRNAQFYENPFNPDGVTPGSFRGLTQIDPYWITPLLDNDAVARPESMHFYEPTYWVISGRRYHRTHFVILRGPEVTDILKPSYIYGGLPLTQRIMERVYASERTANEAPQLAMTKRLTVRHMDLKEAVANQEAFEHSLTVQAEMRDNYGVLAAGKDEEVQQLETSLADLDATIMTQYQLVAATANVPATKLLNTSPKGFNATGEYEAQSYHEELESVQENDLTPVVDKFHEYVARSELPQLVDKGLEIVWNPVDAPTSEDLATVNEAKARADAAYLGMGAVDAYDVRDKIIRDPDSGFSGIESVERPDELDLEPDPIEEFGDGDNEGSGTEEDEKGSGEDHSGSVWQKNGRWFAYGEGCDTVAGPYANRSNAYRKLRHMRNKLRAENERVDT